MLSPSTIQQKDAYTPMRTSIAAIAAASLLALTLSACGDLAETSAGGTTSDKAASDSKSAGSDKTSKSKSTPDKKKSSKLEDKGWVVESKNIKDDGLGDFGGSVRVTNSNDDEQSATMTVTLFKGGKQVASLDGIVNEVKAGKTVTVDLISQDKYKKGPWTYDFQVNASF